jgi:tRNA-specific 2-thiouridylase
MIWISGEPPSLPLSCHAKIRYRQADQACVVSACGAKIEVTFNTPQRAVTPGQSVVFYEDDICLGGGVIEDAQ